MVDMELPMTRLTAVIATLGWLCTTPAFAESYPAKPVTIVVAYPAGGATDVLARAVGRHLEVAWGRPVVIENKGGASTQIAAADVAKTAPDGYTLLATDGTTFINRYLRNKLSYDAEKAFMPVTGLGIIDQTLVVHPSVPAETVADFVALAKAKPGKINYATLGMGSSSHLNME
jgi:tripartite-type tricarboxylate transporter receptor subunit TctC